MREQVFGGKLVRAGELPLQIRHQFTGTQSGTFLNADAVGVEEHQIRSDDATPGGLPFLQHIKPVCACVLLLVETQVPDFHSAPLRTGQRRHNATRILLTSPKWKAHYGLRLADATTSEAPVSDARRFGGRARSRARPQASGALR